MVACAPARARRAHESRERSLRMKKTLLKVASFLFVTAAAGAASANYVCSVTVHPLVSSTIYGSSGSVWYTEYTGPACTGSFVATRRMCTSGATSSICPTSFVLTSSGVYEMAEMLRAAAENDQRMSVGTGGCVGGGSGCINTITFYSN
jgi:hypothetical protein